MFGYEVSYNAGYTSDEIIKLFSKIWLGLAIACIWGIICTWKVYKKAGKPGWASIVPIYNIIALLQIVEKPVWHIILLLVPIVNIFVLFDVYFKLAKKFGHGTGFGLGLIFLSPIFLTILAFGKNQYMGANVNMASMPNVVPMNNGYGKGLEQVQYTGNNPNVAPIQYQETNPQIQSVPLNQQPEINANEQVQIVEQSTPTPSVEPIVQEPINQASVEPIVQEPVAFGEIPTISNNGVASPSEVPVSSVVETQTPASLINPFGGTTSNQSANQFPQELNPKKKCPQCGTELNNDTPVCYMCGNKF